MLFLLFQPHELLAVLAMVVNGRVLDLHCDMLDAVFVLHRFRNGENDAKRLDFRIDKHMSRQRVMIGRDSPQMQLMDVLDALDLANGGADFIQIELGRDRFHENEIRFAPYFRPAGKNNAANDKADQGIEPKQAAEINDQPGDDDADRADQVADKMPQRALHVQVFLFLHASFQHNRQRDIDDESDGGDDQHEPKLDLFRMDKAANAFYEDPDGNDAQGETVQEGSDNFKPEITESKSCVRLPRGKINRRHAQAKRNYVGYHVGGVRQQRQRVGEQSADNFNYGKKQGEQQCDPQCLFGASLIFNVT